jgi:transposase
MAAFDTVSRYFEHSELPVRTLARQNTSSLLPYIDYLRRRRQEGCTTVTELHQELMALGFKGSYHVVWRAYQHLPQPTADVEAAPPRPLVKPLGSRKAAWLLSQSTQRLKPEDQQLRDALCQTNPDIATAHDLTQAFHRPVRERCAAELDAWIASAHQANIPELKRSAAGLAQDYHAVKTALSLHWSNGPDSRTSFKH